MFDTQNQNIVRKISKRSIAINKGRNIVIIFAIVLTTIVLTSIFSIGISYYESYQKQKLQSVGMDYDGEINRPSQEQVRIANELEEVKHAGLQVRCGRTMFYNENILVRFVLTWRDSVNWKEQTLPAIENFQGDYPINENEVAMSEWALNECGIEEYELGMQIPLTYSTLAGEFQKNFTLVGVYRDYSEVISHGNSGIALVSEKFMKNSGYTQEDDGAGKLFLSFENEFIAAQGIKKVENELQLKKNQVLYTDHERVQMLVSTTLGISLLSSLIMICGYLLIYNVLNISVSADVRFYGLMKTTGVTRVQIRKIMWRQINILSIIGIPIGVALGGVISFFIVPSIIYAMSDYLTIRNVSFHPLIFIGAALFTYITTALGSMYSVKKAGDIEPIEALNYTDKKKYKTKKYKRRKNKLFHMAVSNISMNKKKTIFVIASLFIGITSFLTIYVIAQGNNIYNYIEMYRRYEVSLSNETGMSEEYPAKQKFDNEFLRNLKMIEGIQSVETISSEAMVLQYNDEYFADYLQEFYEMYMNESYDEGVERIKEDPVNFQAQFIGISEAIFDDINTENAKLIDKEKFMKGEICLIQSEIALDSLEDKSIYFSFPDLKETYMHSMEVGAWVTPNISRYAGVAPNIIVSDQVIKEYLREPWIEQVEIISTKDFDRNIHNKIKGIVEDDSEISFSSKIQVYDSMESSNRTLTIFGGSISMVLIVIGLLNFVNVMVTGIFQRKKELAYLESMGMTQKQLRKMLVYEGAIYGIISIVLIAVLGSAISLGIFNMIREEHMTYQYPLGDMVYIFVFVLVICTTVPLLIMKYLNKENLIERLKKYN